MSLGKRIINAIEARRERLRKSAPGPHGDFYRNGGNDLLYDLPVSTGSLVIDAGGYEGEWSAKMIARYGCRSIIYEPFPRYADHCKRLYASNTMVRVHASALGGSARTAKFSFAANGTSEFRDTKDVEIVDAPVDDISRVLEALENEPVACLKLNIEGGEYEVLERLLSTHQITRCNSLLIQFHTQPDDWEPRMKIITKQLQITHVRDWSYPMVWEKWVRKANV
jgi:FkbM family methyltransferase